MDVKFHDGLPKRWENKCLDCYSSANLDFSLMLPTSWGQGVYKTWDGQQIVVLNQMDTLFAIYCQKSLNLQHWDKHFTSI